MIGNLYSKRALDPEPIPVKNSQPAGDIVINQVVGCQYFPPGLRFVLLSLQLFHGQAVTADSFQLQKPIVVRLQAEAPVPLLHPTQRHQCQLFESRSCGARHS